jgi:hypothetical protein
MQATHWNRHIIYDGKDYAAVFEKFPPTLLDVKGIGCISQARMKSGSPTWAEYENYEYFTVRFQQYGAGKTTTVFI